MIWKDIANTVKPAGMSMLKHAVLDTVQRGYFARRGNFAQIFKKKRLDYPLPKNGCLKF